jgi:hypothetical protein
MHSEYRDWFSLPLTAKLPRYILRILRQNALRVGHTYPRAGSVGTVLRIAAGSVGLCRIAWASVGLCRSALSASVGLP